MIVGEAKNYVLRIFFFLFIDFGALLCWLFFSVSFFFVCVSEHIETFIRFFGQGFSLRSSSVGIEPSAPELGT